MHLSFAEECLASLFLPSHPISVCGSDTQVEAERKLAGLQQDLAEVGSVSEHQLGAECSRC